MDKINSIDELHQLTLNISKEFHKVCEKHHIPYYMLYGTMLGAKRHQGFIPWDDDMDFGVKFEYYDKLVEALKEDLPERFRCVTRYDRQGAVGGFLKIEDTHTIVKEKSRLHDEDNTGVFIDVFLLYPCSGNKSWLSRSGLIKLCTLIQAYRFYSKKEPKWQLLVSKVTKACFFWLKKPSMINFYERELVPNNGDYMSTYSSVYNLKDIIDINIYGKPQLYRFEDTYLYGVEDDDKYLHHLYGNYMQMPPEDQRRFHLSKVYYKESKEM